MTMMKGAARLVGVVLMGSVLTVYALSDEQKQEIAERIKPVGSLCLEGDSSCGGAVAAAGGASAAKSPEDIYNTNCMACHGTGAAGAPKIGDVAAWKPRISQGLDTLHTHALNGFKGMPPKGLCMSCSEDEIKATVDYIVSKSK